MNLRPLAFSIVLLAACAAGTQAETLSSTASASGDVTAAAKMERPRLKMSDIEWGKTRLCADGDCVVAQEEDKADIRETLQSAKWMCCCAGTTSDSAGDCKCASKESCDGCSC